MRAPVIRQGGNLPTVDGDINLYTAPEAAGASWFNADRRAIFVNGMQNSSADHVASANGVSILQACPVIGVYNRSGGFMADIAQCIRDKLTLSTVQAEFGANFSEWSRLVDLAYQAARLRNAGLSKIDFVATIIERNPATVSLYALLVTSTPGQRTARHILSHSQGNLITSNALTAMGLALGIESLRGIEVSSFGSPCRFWPPLISQQNYVFSLDPVPLARMMLNLTDSAVGFVGRATEPFYAHDFLRYLQYDGEFIVNRFRWGSFGMTASMDEQGLARYLIGLGTNTRRVRSVFERLRDAHWTDSDDVAVAYVRGASDHLLRQVKSHDSALIDLLIRLLSSGVMFPDEREAIARLRRL